jgi:hypothetical protein
VAVGVPPFHRAENWHGRHGPFSLPLQPVKSVTAPDKTAWARPIGRRGFSFRRRETKQHGRCLITRCSRSRAINSPRQTVPAWRGFFSAPSALSGTSPYGNDRINMSLAAGCVTIRESRAAFWRQYFMV